MSNVYQIGQDEQRHEQASIWLARMDRGLSLAEEGMLDAWVHQDKRNGLELLSLAEMWDKMDALAQLSVIFPHPAESAGSAKSVGLGGSKIAVWASVVMLVGVASLFSIFEFSDESASANIADATIYETAIGGLSTAKLSDGSFIILNTNSRVEVQYDDQQRVIWLERGEIHIDVAHDPDRPLVVIALDKKVEAVGTAFSVKIDDSQRIEVLVADGKVKVGVKNADVDQAVDGENSIAKKEPIHVARGERLLIGASDEELDVLEPEEIEVQLSWRKGNLVFRGESLAEAAAEVGRYTLIEFVIEDEKLKRQRVAGLFKAGDVTGFLGSLEANFDVMYKRVDDQTISLSSSKGGTKDSSSTE